MKIVEPKYEILTDISEGGIKELQQIEREAPFFGALHQVQETRIVAVPAPCDFRFSPCFFPHGGRMASIPRKKPEVSGFPSFVYHYAINGC